MKRLFVIAMALCFAIIVSAQESAPLGNVILPSLNSSNYISINADKGILNSIIELKEPGRAYASSDDGTKFYLMSPHYSYCIDAATGNILSEYQHMEILPMEEYDSMDPAYCITPIGITPDGIGFYSFNRAMTDKRAYASNRASKNQIFKVNILEKSQEKYMDIDIPNIVQIAKNIPVLNEHNIYLMKDASREGVKYDKMDTEGNVVDELFVSLSNIPDSIFNNSIKVNVVGVSFLKQNVVNVTVNVTKQANSNTYSYIYNLVDKKKLAILNDKEYQTYLLHQNCNNLFVIEKSCPPNPMPVVPKYMPPKKNKDIDKATEEHNKNLKEYEVAFKKWLEIDKERRISGGDCTYKLVNLNDLNKPLLDLKEAAGYIINDKYIIFNTGLETVMYNIETKELVWEISDF